MAMTRLILGDRGAKIHYLAPVWKHLPISRLQETKHSNLIICTETQSHRQTSADEQKESSKNPLYTAQQLETS